jgi:hypothetical protein
MKNGVVVTSIFIHCRTSLFSYMHGPTIKIFKKVAPFVFSCCWLSLETKKKKESSRISAPLFALLRHARAAAGWSGGRDAEVYPRPQIP